MKLTLNRTAKRPEYTIGHLYINDVLFCDTCEDAVRPDGVKIPGQTAIPAGTYEIVISYSNRFRKMLPLLLNVPMFEGVRIHSGNTADDSEGCILVGSNTKRGMVTNSRATMAKLMEILETAIKKEKITIEIK